MDSGASKLHFFSLNIESRVLLETLVIIVFASTKFDQINVIDVKSNW
jgi:hypothetical protein